MKNPLNWLIKEIVLDGMQLLLVIFISIVATLVLIAYASVAPAASRGKWTITLYGTDGKVVRQWTGLGTKPNISGDCYVRIPEKDVFITGTVVVEPDGGTDGK